MKFMKKYVQFGIFQVHKSGIFPYKTFYNKQKKTGWTQ